MSPSLLTCIKGVFSNESRFGVWAAETFVTGVMATEEIGRDRLRTLLGFFNLTAGVRALRFYWVSEVKYSANSEKWSANIFCWPSTSRIFIGYRFKSICRERKRSSDRTLFSVTRWKPCSCWLIGSFNMAFSRRARLNFRFGFYLMYKSSWVELSGRKLSAFNS